MKRPTEKTQLHILTECNRFAMGGVLITPKACLIVIDGGHSEEWKNPKYHIGTMNRTEHSALHTKCTASERRAAGCANWGFGHTA